MSRMHFLVAKQQPMQSGAGLPCRYAVRAAYRLIARMCTHSDAAVTVRENSSMTPLKLGRNCGRKPPAEHQNKNLSVSMTAYA